MKITNEMLRIFQIGPMKDPTEYEAVKAKLIQIGEKIDLDTEETYGGFCIDFDYWIEDAYNASWGTYSKDFELDTISVSDFLSAEFTPEQP